MSERVLFHDMAAERLRARARWCGVVFAAAILVPYEVVGDVPQWIWGLFSELPAAAIVAALAPSLAGLTMLIARATCKRPASLALAMIGALGAAAIVARIGADASAWEALRLPESLARRPWPSLLAMSFAGAGANLTFQPHTRRAARALFGAAFVALLLHYLWPVRGQAPVVAIAHARGGAGSSFAPPSSSRTRSSATCRSGSLVSSRSYRSPRWSRLSRRAPRG